MLEPRKEGDQVKLATPDGSREISIEEKVWNILKDEEILLDDFVRVIQSYTLQNNKEWALILKDECPDADDYRVLRSKIRLVDF